MPFIGIGFSTLIAICFAIRVIRKGQDRYWLFILLLFPFLGSIIYFFAIFLPSLRTTSSAYKIESKLIKVLDPSKELRSALNEVELSPTTQNQLRLAKALVDNDRASEALSYYEKALNGIFKTAPDILLEYAYALYLDKQYQKARETLDLLRQSNPNFRSDEGHLLYAKILVELDDKQQAQEEFDALIDYFPNLEAVSYYLQTLIRWQRYEEAKKQLQELDIRLKHMPRHAKQLNTQWIREINQLRSQIM